MKVSKKRFAFLPKQRGYCMIAPSFELENGEEESIVSGSQS